MSAPDKIWANPYYGMQPHQTSGIWKLENVNGKGTEYTRTDLTPPAADYVATKVAYILDGLGLDAPDYKIDPNETWEDLSGKDVAKIIVQLSEALTARHASPDTRVRCAECNCANGGDDCNWIKTPALSAAEARAVGDENDCRETLSALSSYLGAGMGDDKTTPEQFRERIDWGVDHQIGAAINRAAGVVERMSQQRPTPTWGEVRTAILALAPTLHPASPLGAVTLDSFDQLIAEAKAEAARAMIKFPQPNYVISKVAEEAGEVVKAAIHCAEGRETPENVIGEMRQIIAMLYRLWVEGDHVHGLAALAPFARKGE